MNKLKVKKGDNVIVITGKDKGQVGKIQTIFKNKNTVIVTGLNLKTKHLKSTNKEDPGKILNIEAPIHQSNIMLILSYSNSGNINWSFRPIL